MEGGIILALVGMVTLIVLVLMGVHIAVALGTVGFFGLVACLNLSQGGGHGRHSGLQRNCNL